MTCCAGSIRSSSRFRSSLRSARRWVCRRSRTRCGNGPAGPLPFPPCVERWLNVADRLDPVAFDNDISNDFDGTIENISGIGLNPDSPRHPHSATGYLRPETCRRRSARWSASTFEQEIGLVHDRQGSGRRSGERASRRSPSDAHPVGRGTAKATRSIQRRCGISRNR